MATYRTRRTYRTRISVDRSYHSQSKAVVEAWSGRTDSWNEVARLIPTEIDVDVFETEDRLLTIAALMEL